MESSDQHIWDKLRGGDKSALESIYRSEVDYLYNYCLRLSQDQQLIEDAIQELFVELWNRKDKLGSTDSIRPYLTTSIRRKVIHQLKQKGKKSGDIEAELSFKTDEAIESSIILKEEEAENKIKLAHSMDDLSPRQREAIYHKFYNEYDYDKICEIMGLNYQSARNLISSGLRKMKVSLLNNPLFWILLSTLLELFS